jgi:hypothetical protein
LFLLTKVTPKIDTIKLSGNVIVISMLTSTKDFRFGPHN